MPDGNCYLVNLINNKFLYLRTYQPINKDILEIHLSRFPDDRFISNLREDYIDIYEGIEYDYCISENNKNKPFKRAVYEYNEHGDWVKLIWYSRKKEPLYITEREISYYPADNNSNL